LLYQLSYTSVCHLPARLLPTRSGQRQQAFAAIGLPQKRMLLFLRCRLRTGIFYYLCASALFWQALAYTLKTDLLSRKKLCPKDSDHTLNHVMISTE
jgi:hypothetical protein